MLSKINISFININYNIKYSSFFFQKMNSYTHILIFFLKKMNSYTHILIIFLKKMNSYKYSYFF